jgi:hypothetical protein
VSSVLALLALHLVLVVPAIVARANGSSAHGDMTQFHIPQINHFIQHPFDFFDYRASSATTPGLHIFFGWSARLLGYAAIDEHSMPMRFLNVGFALGLLALAWSAVFRLSGSPLLAFCLAAPLTGSSYVLSGSMCITTDNGAMLFYALGLWTLLFARDRPWLGALANSLMVMWRQLYLPVIGAFGLVWLLEGRKKRELLLALAACVPPVLLVGLYVYHWGGLTPAVSRNYNEARFNVAVPLNALALTGLFALPFALHLLAPLEALSARDRRLAAVGGGVVALGVWLAGPSSYDFDAARWGSVVWALAGKTPLIADRSPAVLLLAVLGGALLAAMLLLSHREQRVLPELFVLGSYLVGYCAQVFAWQRYIEPAIFLTLAVFSARRPSRWRLAPLGPLALAILFMGLTQARIWGLVGRVLG